MFSKPNSSALVQRGNTGGAGVDTMHTTPVNIILDITSFKNMCSALQENATGKLLVRIVQT